jgi:hypothetical protein
MKRKTKWALAILGGLPVILGLFVAIATEIGPASFVYAFVSTLVAFAAVWLVALPTIVGIQRDVDRLSRVIFFNLAALFICLVGWGLGAHPVVWPD